MAKSNDKMIANNKKAYHDYFIEDKYAYVDHMRFRGICDYATTYQAVTNTTPDASTLTRDERRYYVPEILNVPLEYIYLTMYKL